MIPIYEQIKRAAKGEVLYTTSPARNVTSAAARLGRKVKTQRGMYIPNGAVMVNRPFANLLRVQVLS